MFIYEKNTLTNRLTNEYTRFIFEDQFRAKSEEFVIHKVEIITRTIWASNLDMDKNVSLKEFLDN